MKTFKLITASLLFTATTLFAGGESYHEFARVTSSEPIYEYVYEKVPKKECYEEQVRVKKYKDNYYDSNSIGLDTIIGATTGVVIGNQIGKGNGRTAAKIIGGIVGGAVANNMRDRYETNGYDDYEYETRTKCYNKSKRVQRKMITGYKNYFTYNGREHFKISHKPRKKVRITHTINF